MTLKMSLEASLGHDLQSRRTAPFFLITGGKGGVGKTTVAANIGVQFARQGRRVLLVDLDLGLANLHVVLRLPTGPTIEDALYGNVDFADCVREGPGGVSVLPASSGTAELGRPDRLRRERLLAGIRELSRDYDLVIGDSAAGIGPDVLGFACAAEHVCVVTSPQHAAVTDAYGLIKALHTFGVQADDEVPTPQVFVNMAAGTEEASQTWKKLRTVCERFLSRSPRMGGWLPRSAAVAGAGAARKPFVMESRNRLENNCLRQVCARFERLVGVN